MERAYIIVYQSNIEELEATLKSNGIERYIILNNQIASIYLPLAFREEKLNTIEIISWWQRSSPMSSLIQLNEGVEGGDSVSAASGIDFVYNNPYLNITGKRTIIAIIDSGIDYLHPDFITKDGTSKILAIWDQTKEGTPPDGCLFGDMITREEINKAITENDSSLTEDNVGTGTIAAGIASGRGALNSNYSGMAIDSELVVVKLKEYKNRFDNGKRNYQSADFLAAIKFIEDIYNSEEKQKNIVINMTVGKGSVSSVEASFLDTFSYLRDSGVIVVGGAGNEANTDIHYHGVMQSTDVYQDIVIQVGNQINLELYIYVTGPDKVRALLISPSGELSYEIVYAPDNYAYTGRFNLENTAYEMQFVYPWIETGSQKLFMDLYDIKPGVWILRLKPEFIINGIYDVYLPNKNLISESTRFLDPQSTETITSYGVIENVITVGTFNNKTDSIWIGSSKGPVNGWRIKPDIVAPGVDIIAPYINQSYAKATGTGVSSSMVSGVLAILMDYITQQSIFSRRSMYTQVLKTYLMLGAYKPETYVFPNIVQGFGILDLKQTLKAISEILE